MVYMIKTDSNMVIFDDKEEKLVKYYQLKQLSTMLNINKANLKWYAPLIATISHIIIMTIAEFFRNAESWKDSISLEIDMYKITLFIIGLSYIYILTINQFQEKVRKIIYFISIGIILILNYLFTCLISHDNFLISLLIEFLLVASYLIPFFYILIRYNEPEKTKM